MVSLIVNVCCIVIVCMIVPCQEFSFEMKQSELLAFLNSKGISYKVCKILKGKVEQSQYAIGLKQCLSIAMFQKRVSKPVLLI